MKIHIGDRSSGGATDIRSRHHEGSDAHIKCGNLECSRRWFSLLKDRRRPLFEGRWGCSAECVQLLVASAIHREAIDTDIRTDDGTHRHRLPLGLMMVELGWITPAQLSCALAMQKREKTGRMGDWLIRECGVDKARVTRALAMQWGCPVLPIAGINAAPMALAAPKLLVDTFGFIPLKIAVGRRLYLAFANCPDASAVYAMEHMSGLKVEKGIVETAEWNSAMASLDACEFVCAALDEAEDYQSLVRRVSSTVVGLQPRASRLVRVHQFYWLRMWLEDGAMSSSRAGGIPNTKEDVVDRLYVLDGKQ